MQVDDTNGTFTHPSDMGLDALRDDFCPMRVFLCKHGEVLDYRSRVDSKLFTTHRIVPSKCVQIRRCCHPVVGADVSCVTCDRYASHKSVATMVLQ